MKKLYIFGSILLFLGLLWMFLPHAVHTSLTREKEITHIFHTLEGFAVVVIGLGIMIYAQRMP